MRSIIQSIIARLPNRLGDVRDDNNGGGGIYVLGDPPPPSSRPDGADVNASVNRSHQQTSDGGTAVYDGEIPGLQRCRLCDLPVLHSSWDAHVPTTPPVAWSPPVDAAGSRQRSDPTAPVESTNEPRWLHWLEVYQTATWPEHVPRIPLPWSFLLIVPSNLLVGCAVLSSDGGVVAVAVVCATSGVSILMVVAEAIGRR